MSEADLRPSWDELWMEMARLVSRRSVDPRFKVGCIVVSDDNQRVLALGYNGMERGGPNNVDSTEPGQSGTIHAEINALIKLNPSSHRRKVLYTTLSPCVMCARAIVNAAVDEVVYEEEYRDTSGIEILVERGVVVRQFSIPPR